MRTVGRWVGRARAHARHFTAGIENMMREAELEEMEKRWREENERIMRDHPVAAPYPGAPDFASPPVTTAEPPSPPQPVTPAVTGAAVPPATTLNEEPALPLPEPEHHRRELP
jgi:sec-independent protein translocase protein TatB